MSSYYLYPFLSLFLIVFVSYLGFLYIVIHDTWVLGRHSDISSSPLFYGYDST